MPKPKGILRVAIKAERARSADLHASQPIPGEPFPSSRCSCCGEGTVWKEEHILRCDRCGAIGDLVTGIMDPPTGPLKRSAPWA